MRISAYRSPCSSRGPGSPWPRSRRLRPEDEPFGTLTRAVPVSVGTSTSAPSAASHGVTGSVGANVAAVHLEPRMRLQSDAQKQVPGRAATETRSALPGQPDALAVTDAGWNLDLVIPAVPQRDLAPPAGRGLLERQLEDGLMVASARCEVLERRVAEGRASSAEHRLEEVAEVAVAELDVDVAETVSWRTAEAIGP